ncbi:MAG: hypothetical protein KGR98_05840, partial [Verrucomicrobia bacterium]|nr:hypothetical protein [Verrucomicrobiota bacterium]
TDMHSSADTNASPWGLAFDNNGNLWVADSATNQIDEYNSSGILVTQIANTNLNQPSGLAFDSTGNLYVANFNTNTIVKFVGGVGAVFATNGVPGVFGGDISAVATLVPEPSIQALLAIGAMLALVSSRLARCRHFRRAGS